MRARMSSPPLSKVRMLAPVVADHAGDAGEHAGTVFGEDAQAHRKGGLRGRGPFDGDAPLGFVEQIFDVGAILAVDGDAAAARDVADDVVTRNRIAAFRAVDHQVVVAAHDDRGVVACRACA